ncbi:hypothetical protein HGB25_01760 [Candidatus Saccharibacteria bacterium]|nr:hypothetical protein [Candidatus Saccharibacteria bacterium]
MSHPPIKANNLRKLLITSLTAMAVISIAGFYFATSWLNTLDTDSAATSTHVDDKSGNATLAKDLENQKNNITRASKITYISQDYVSSVEKDVRKYASSTGIQIVTVSQSSRPSGYVSQQLDASIQSDFVEITLQNPVGYANLIKFITYIETNLPKMKLTGISLERTITTGSVTVNPITIEVYKQ